VSDPALTSWRPMVRQRAVACAAVVALWTAGIEARLVYLQVYQHDELQVRAQRQQMRTVVVPPKRGDILDRNGRILAYSVDGSSIYAVPNEIADPAATASKLCAGLERCSSRERAALTEKLRRRSAFTFVRRQVSPADAQRIGDLNLEGIGFIKESQRFYPKKELAAQLLGFVGVDNVGLAGIEAAYDKKIRGKPGTILVQTDAHRHAFSRLERPPTAGATIELTIDEYLQHVAERELRAGVEANRAAGGIAVVMDVRTGEILALANEPTFNPHDFAIALDEQKRNRAVQDVYEPGSTFKVVTASAALEEGIISLDDPVDASGGRIRLGSRVIDEAAGHDYGVLSFTDVIVKSSNVGAIKMGLRLGPQRLGTYIRRFGFGSRLSPDFPAETAGIVWDPGHVDASALASMSMGYQVGVTALQMAAAVSSVANGGSLMEPRVVRALIQDGRRIVVQPRRIRTTVNSKTTAQLTGIMEAVVERGTATAAKIPGYTIAGKTGTAAKVVNGHYSQTAYNASFVGFIPSRKPALTIIVVVDSPRAGTYYGGTVAAPIFKRIAEASLQQLGIAPTVDAPPPVLVERYRPQPVIPTVAALGPSILSAEISADLQTLPDFRGLSAREVVQTLTRIGMTARLSGEGFVVEQNPAPGAPIERGAACEVRLARGMPVPAVQQ
jgi:cell division protein FtsI (penicillin-binding protein 3)